MPDKGTRRHKAKRTAAKFQAYGIEIRPTDFSPLEVQKSPALNFAFKYLSKMP